MYECLHPYSKSHTSSFTPVHFQQWNLWHRKHKQCIHLSNFYGTQGTLTKGLSGGVAPVKYIILCIASWYNGYDRKLWHKEECSEKCWTSSLNISNIKFFISDSREQQKGCYRNLHLNLSAIMAQNRQKTKLYNHTTKHTTEIGMTLRLSE